MLLELLPERFQQNTEMVEIQNALEKEVQKKIAAYDQFLLQLFILSADEGISFWEKMYGVLLLLSAIQAMEGMEAAMCQTRAGFSL